MTALVPNVTGEQLAEIIGRANDASWIARQGDLFANIARSAASSYCRGVGFDDPDQIPASLWHVVLMRGVRLVQNYSQLTSETVDSVTMVYGMAGQGFTLQELKDLDDYRVLAA